MKIKYDFETTELGDQIVAVPVGDGARDFKGVITVNASGAAILERLRKETTVEEITASLMEEYEGTKEALMASVEKMVVRLRSEGLLDE